MQHYIIGIAAVAIVVILVVYLPYQFHKLGRLFEDMHS